MVPPEISIRRASVRDVAKISALFVELDEYHFRLRPDLFKRIDGPARDQETIAAFIAAPDQAIFVAEDSASGALAGFVHVREKLSPETFVSAADRSAEIDALLVSAAHRQRAIGSMLVEQAEQWAREFNLSSLVLSVRAFNVSAVAAYEAMGFELLTHRMGRAIPLSDKA